MKKWCLPILLLLGLVGCSSLNTDLMDSVAEQVNNETSISKYLDGKVTHSHYSGGQHEKYKFIYFEMKGQGNQSFRDLSNEDKYNILLQAVEIIKDKTEYHLECGKNRICEVERFFIGDYAINLDDDSDLALLHKGQKVFTPAKNEDNSIPVTNPPSSINKQSVYEYMKEQYDIITDYGNNYDPNVHDPMVAKMASQMFGISETEAGAIYVEFEMSGY